MAGKAAAADRENLKRTNRFQSRAVQISMRNGGEREGYKQGSHRVPPDVEHPGAGPQFARALPRGPSDPDDFPIVAMILAKMRARPIGERECFRLLENRSSTPCSNALTTLSCT